MTHVNTCVAGMDEASLSCVRISAVTTTGDLYDRIPVEDFAELALDSLAPIRRFATYPDQQRHPGRYWCATTAAHVGYESRLEAAHLTLLDFDPDVTWIVSQPFRLHYSLYDEPRSHVPDFLVRAADGAWRIVNVALARRQRHPDVAERLSVCEHAFKRVGIRAVVRGSISRTLLANVRLISTCRVPPLRLAEYSPQILAAGAEPTTLGSLAASIGPRALVLPVVYHLLWIHRLTTDLTRPLSDDTVLQASGSASRPRTAVDAEGDADGGHVL
jgi:hypothetical protein